jgi:HTH-type transcriptional regulator/antitoxin HipB
LILPLVGLLLHPKGIKTLNLSSLIRFHRKAAGLSQVELAALANVSRKVVQCIETGGEQVAWKNVQAVLAVLNVSLTPTGPLVSQWQEGVEHNDLEP